MNESHFYCFLCKSLIIKDKLKLMKRKTFFNDLAIRNTGKFIYTDRLIEH